MDYKFNDIRPYYDSEIPAAMRRIAESELFPLISSYVFPERDIDDIRNMINGIRTIDQFQHQVMAVANEQIIKRSVSRFTYGGIEGLDRNKRYLFVSNHRDIMLDSSLLQYLLHLNGHETSEITFGANLMCHPLVIDIGKANKMFKVERGGNKKELYRAFLHLSDYIRHVITEKKQSVWIAQRNGRTKDGVDLTEPGLISMFASSYPSDKIKALDELNIVPVAISYEWETCDILKALELYESRITQYRKRPGEDLNSIISGIFAEKGHVHIEICKPIMTEELQQLDNLTKQDYVKRVAKMTDQRIYDSYLLHPTNYIAYDLRYGTERFARKYTIEQKQAFEERRKEVMSYESCDLDILNDIYLGIYANPVTCKMNNNSSL